MKVELNTAASAIEWSAGELVKLRERIELGIERCWEINQRDELFMRAWGGDRDYGMPTTALMTEFFESAHIQSVESGDLGAVHDVEGAYIAWQSFRKLAERINRDRAS